MGYALATLWHERSRYLPGVLAVAFSAVLIALQCGLLLGLFSITTIPIDNTKAHLWIGSPEVLSVDLGQRIPTRFMDRLSDLPIERTEVYIQSFAYWIKPSDATPVSPSADPAIPVNLPTQSAGLSSVIEVIQPPERRKGGAELCIVIGSRLSDDALGCVNGLSAEHRALLSEPGTVVVDQDELDRLQITGIGDTAQIAGRRVKVVGLVRGMKSLAGPYVFCSIETARGILRMRPDQCTYVLARTTFDPDTLAGKAKLDQLTATLQDRFRDMSVKTANDFMIHSRMHWLTKTRAGIAIGYAALLGLLVGAVVTSQTLFAAAMASVREYAILLALGIPRWRLAAMILVQSFWVGVLGLVIALPTVYLLAGGAEAAGTKVRLHQYVLIGAAVVTMIMALLSGFMAARSVRKIEPMSLLR